MGRSSDEGSRRAWQNHRVRSSCPATAATRHACSQTPLTLSRAVRACMLRIGSRLAPRGRRTLLAVNPDIVGQGGSRVPGHACRLRARSAVSLDELAVIGVGPQRPCRDGCRAYLSTGKSGSAAGLDEARVSRRTGWGGRVRTATRRTEIEPRRHSVPVVNDHPWSGIRPIELAPRPSRRNRNQATLGARARRSVFVSSSLRQRLHRCMSSRRLSSKSRLKNAASTASGFRTTTTGLRIAKTWFVETVPARPQGEPSRLRDVRPIRQDGTRVRPRSRFLL